MLTIDGQTVTYTKYDMATGLYPYNVAITPNGKLAIAGNNGDAGASDGQVDTAAIIDMEAIRRGSSTRWWSATAPKASP